MEKKEEDKSGGEHVNFVYSIGVEEKGASFCVDSTNPAIHSGKRLCFFEKLFFREKLNLSIVNTFEKSEGCPL
jgi:hypothetical protein